MRFCVLGPLQAIEAGRSAAIGGGRQRALLGLLLVHAGEIVSRDRLIDELWHGDPPPSGSQSLDVYVSRLRKAFRDLGADEVLHTRAPGYVLEAREVDARDFERLTSAGSEALATGAPDRAARLLREALALWRGRAYIEVADEPWARGEAERLEELRMAATEDRIEAELALGRHVALVPELELLARRHPARERFVSQLMLALYRSGRQVDALAAYRDARRMLAEELGLEPSPELRRLEHAVLAHDASLDLQRDSSPDRPPTARRTRRWIPTPLMAGCVVGIAATALSIAAVSGRSGHNQRLLPPDSVSAFDLASGQVTTSVRLRSTPTAIAGAAGRVWISNAADGTVTRIDPRVGRPDQTIDVGSSPAGLVSAAGALWVANSLDGSLSRIDPGAGVVVQTIRAGQRPVALAAGARSIWVADSTGDAVIPVGTKDGRPRPALRLDDSPHGIAFAFGSVWVTEPATHRVVRLDPRTGATEAEIGVGAGAGPVTAGHGAIWVVNTLDGTLTRVDPLRNVVTSTTSVGASPSAVLDGPSDIWVTDAGAGALVSVDPATGRVRRRFNVGGAPSALGLVASVPWIASSPAEADRHRGGTLRVSYTKIRHLDPAVPFEVLPGIWHALGDGLVTLGQGGSAADLVPDLATAIPRATDGGRTYSFELRPGIRYSTGERVRPSDFRRALERVFRLRSDLSGMYAAIAGARACARRASRCDLSDGVLANDRTGRVVFRLVRPDPDFLFKLTFPSAWPAPAATPADRLVRTGVPGTGPYRVARFIPGGRLVLTRNARFHEWSHAAQPDGFADRIVVRMADDPNARARAALRGGTDIALEIQSTRVNSLRLSHTPQLRRHSQPETEFYAFNVRRPPFDDVRVRQAVNLAVDRAAFVRALGGQRIAAMTCQILPANFPAHADYCPWTRSPHDGRWHGPDLARARALVRVSGTAGRTVRVVTRGFSDNASATVAVLTNALRRLGYHPVVTRDSRRWDIGAGDWIADYPSPADFLDYFLSCRNYRPRHPQESTNAGGFCDPMFDRLVARAEALQATDPQRAQALWAKADRRAVDQAAWLPLATMASVELLSPRVGHFTLDANSQPAIDQLWVR